MYVIFGLLIIFSVYFAIAYDRILILALLFSFDGKCFPIEILPKVLFIFFYFPTNINGKRTYKTKDQSMNDDDDETI